MRLLSELLFQGSNSDGIKPWSGDHVKIKAIRIASARTSRKQASRSNKIRSRAGDHRNKIRISLHRAVSKGGAGAGLQQLRGASTNNIFHNPTTNLHDLKQKQSMCSLLPLELFLFLLSECDPARNTYDGG